MARAPRYLATATAPAGMLLVGNIDLDAHGEWVRELSGRPGDYLWLRPATAPGK